MIRKTGLMTITTAQMMMATSTIACQTMTDKSSRTHLSIHSMELVSFCAIIPILKLEKSTPKEAQASSSLKTLF
jgi:hypothetical protein